MFCAHCGTKLEEGQRFCSSCGKGSATGVAAEGRVSQHLTLVGIFWIVLSGFRLVGAAVVLAVGMLMIPFIPADISLPTGLFPTLMSMVGGGLLLTALAGLVTGFGLLGRRPWARILAVIMAFLSLLEIPFGTALAIYTLWVLLPAEREAEYKRLASSE